jgi:periplasmic nitrate reductase NapE
MEEMRASDRLDTLAEDPQRKKEEFRTWLFLALVMAPVLSVLIVSAFGFAVWFYQIVTGPMTV